MKKHVLDEQRIDSFEEYMQYLCGATADLQTILDNLTIDEIKEEIKNYAIDVAKQALKNASKHFDKNNEVGLASISVITSEYNLPNLS